MTRLTLLPALAALALATAVPAQDLEREARWRAEVLAALVVGEAVQIPGPAGQPFLGVLTEPSGTGRDRTTLVVLVHGIGVHPDHGIIGKLRMDLADRGYATLSIQMPVLASDASPEQYAPLVGHAVERIGSAAVWARTRGYRDLVLVSHSLGSRMANAYFDGTKPPAFRAWAALGLNAPFTPTFSCSPPVPVLDVLGERDLAPVLTNAGSREAVAKASGARQHRMADTDHFYAGREAELADVVADFARRK